MICHAVTSALLMPFSCEKLGRFIGLESLGSEEPSKAKRQHSSSACHQKVATVVVYLMPFGA